VRPAEPPTYDLASEFLSTVCTAPSGAAFGTAWLAYERRHWDWYEPLYYPDADSDNERTARASSATGATRSAGTRARSSPWCRRPCPGCGSRCRV
jgi:hypothetical protein